MRLQELHHKYIAAEPFPHIVIDDALHPKIMERVTKAYPGPNDVPWFKYDNVFENKLAYNKIEEFPEALHHLCYSLNSPTYVEWLEILTGIPHLSPDDGFRGGGLHCMERGGKLDIHADFNIHPDTGLHRRVNSIVFFNKYWDDDWGGRLEFWDDNMSRCVQQIAPKYNRMVIFNVTDKSYHGLPEPICCPKGMLRKSMAWYYYTKDRPGHETYPAHSTLYQKRPTDTVNEQTEELRTKRAKGRLADLRIEVSR